MAELVEDHGARFIDVMAPEGGDVFRLYEVEYSLACGMDGERDVAGIVRWAQEELGLTPSQQEVRAVIATLGDLGFIDTAARAEAPELAPGVVAAPPERAPASPAVELGAAGGSPRRATPAPIAPDLALGAPGAPRTTKPTPIPGQNDVMLGAAGARAARPGPMPSPTDVSVDLADHDPVRPDDVKEAVRASKVMTVELPPDIDVPPEVLEDRPTSPGSPFDGPTEVVRPDDPPRPPAIVRPGEARAVEPARPAERHRTPVPGVTPLPGEVRVVDIKPPARPPVTMTRPPVELPPPPFSAEPARPAPAPPPPVPRAGIHPAVMVVVIVMVVAIAGFAVWKFVLDKPSVDAEVTPVAPPPVKPAAPPPPPPPPTAKVALETPEPVEVKMGRAGVIETIQTDKAAVKEGDVVARLVGDKPIEAERAGLDRDRKRLRDQIDAATKRRDTAHDAGNKAAETAAANEIADREKALANKDKQFNAKTTDLEAFLLHAPASGAFLPAAKLGQKLPSAGLVGKVQHDPIPVATFKLDNTRSFAANAGVEITRGEQRVTCTVADVQPDSVKVVCPSDPALSEGAEVALLAPSAASPSRPEAAPAPAGESGAPPAPSGAPAGSAAPPGEPAAGSSAAAPAAAGSSTP